MKEKIATLDDAKTKYQISKEEEDLLGEKINELMLYGKRPVENPIAIIDIAPPGSGKTGLNGYALSQFNDSNLVIVNNDELKPFYPKANEIAELYPEYYIKVTNESSKVWTDNLLYTAIDKNYNVLYEGTGRKLFLFQKMIEKMKNHKIIVRAMAVNELNCLMSIIERYQGQIKEKGWGRIVSKDTFYKAYQSEMVDTIEFLEKSGLADIVEVYTRGETPEKPIRIYNSNIHEFPDAKTAINYRKGKRQKYCSEIL